MYLTQLLHRHLQCRPDKTALVCNGRRLSYAQLHRQVALRAGVLQAAGVKPGDRVALLSHHSIETVEWMFACWWIGAVFSPQNTRWSEPEIADALRDSEPAVLLHDSAHAALARSLAQLAPVARLLPMDLATDGIAPEDLRCGGDALAALIYTGGTTGRSKGVMLGHAALSSAALGRLAELPPLDDSVTLLTTPNFHVASLIRGITHWIAGSTVVIQPQFRAAEVLQVIERESVTDVPFVPTMLQMVLDDPGFSPARMRSVRRLSYGAAPSAQALLQRAQAALPWAGLHQYYGMTESCGAATASLPADHDEQAWASGRAAAAGRASAVVELRIVDAGGRDLPPGQIGEILLRGPLLASGYWRRPQETAQTFRAGWLHTGDAGRLDADGYLYVVDRIKDMIVSGGENAYSAEVENALARHPAVAMATVFGIPHERWGEAVHAVVMLRPGTSADEAGLRAHCRAFLADYKVPKRVEFTDALPLTPAGKVSKTTLRARYAQP